jgi:hypothetical protein
MAMSRPVLLRKGTDVNKEIITLFFSLAIVVACKANAPTSTNHNVATPTPTPAGSASPQLFTYKLLKAGLQFEWLEGWRVERQADNSVLVAAPENGLVIQFAETEPNAAQQRIEQYLKGFLQDITPIKLPKLKEGNFKGMKHLSQSGQVTNALNGATIEWSIDVLEAKTPLVIFSQLNRAYKTRHEASYGKLISSLKPLE